jgi:hypothetical protein
MFSEVKIQLVANCQNFELVIPKALEDKTVCNLYFYMMRDVSTFYFFSAPRGKNGTAFLD